MLSTGHWIEEQRLEAGHQVRRLVVFSALAHVALALALILAPGPNPLRAPPALTVDLVASLPLAAPPAPAPKAKAPARKVKAPAPKALAPAPQPKVKILPKQAPAAVTKPRPKARPEPKPEPVLRRRARPKELSYADALAQLRGEAGELAPPTPSPATPAPSKIAPVEATAPSRGVRVSPELLAWHLAVRRHVRAGWITPPEFRNRGLVAELVIDLDAGGRVLGRPELVRSSGNPFYDDNAIRALVKASPLPAPPEAGRRTVVFTPEE